MAKKQKKIIETMEFDNYAEAKELVATTQRRRTRILIGMGIAAVSTVLSLFGIFGEHEMWPFFVVFGVILAIPAYLIGGGFGTALRTAGNLAKFGWFILPFPADIFTGLFTFFLAVMGFFCIPLLFVFLNYVKHNRDYKAARKYMSFYRRVNSEV